jgi:hypothetical protein
MIGMPPTQWYTAVAVAVLLLMPSGEALAQEADPEQAAAAAEERIEVEKKAAVESAGQSLDKARSLRTEANVENVDSQRRIDVISDATETLFSKYSNALKQTDSIRVYNSQMRELIASQDAELASLQSQLDRIEVVGRSVMPLMSKMVDAYESLVGLDLPFLLDERKERVVSLRKLMSRSDVTSAEKYRRIMEAYQIENEYGRTIEAYRSTIELGGREVTVDFLRFGRIALVYQTPDGTEAGVWNQSTRSWQEIDPRYRGAIRDGLRIARKQAAPDLIRLPLPAAGKEAS